MKPCKNCGWIGRNIGCDTCGPPLRERKVNRPSGETTCSASSDTPVADAATWSGHCGDGDWGPVVYANVARDLECQRNSAIAEIAKWSDAYGYVIGTLQTHHMSRPGIATLIRNAEKRISQNAEALPPAQLQRCWFETVGLMPVGSGDLFDFLRFVRLAMPAHAINQKRLRTCRESPGPAGKGLDLPERSGTAG